MPIRLSFLDSFKKGSTDSVHCLFPSSVKSAVAHSQLSATWRMDCREDTRSPHMHSDSFRMFYPAYFCKFAQLLCFRYCTRLAYEQNSARKGTYTVTCLVSTIWFLRHGLLLHPLASLKNRQLRRIKQILVPRPQLPVMIVFSSSPLRGRR